MKMSRRKKSGAKMKPPGSSALNDERATLGWLRQMMREFVAERAWQKYHTPRNLAASVAVEAGELLELFQWWTTDEGDRRKRDLMADAAFKHAVGEELCDVMMYCVSLANAMDLEIAPTIAAKMAKNRLKYPPEKFQGHYERPLPT